MTKPITDMAASVHARLLKRARAEGRPFSELLQYFAMERFLYRLSRSGHGDRFVLKGALMLQLWGCTVTRATKDIDLLGRTTTGLDDLVEIFRACFDAEVADDGLRFHRESLSAEATRLDAHYDGVRIRFRSSLGRARISLQADIGFGDAINPGPQELVYPSLLNFDRPRLLGYTPETAIAEKLQAMVVLDLANSRMKDFFDIWALAEGREFEGKVMAKALEATFRRRRTPLPQSIPVALTPAFCRAPAKQAQWRAYLRKGGLQGNTPPLDEAASAIDAFVVPVFQALAAGTPPPSRWNPGGPWSLR